MDRLDQDTLLVRTSAAPGTLAAAVTPLRDGGAKLVARHARALGHDVEEALVTAVAVEITQRHLPPGMVVARCADDDAVDAIRQMVHRRNEPDIDGT